MPTFWGAFPNLQSFVINKFPADFPFDHNDLAKQTSDVIELLSKRCDDIAMGFLMTYNSSQTRSDMNSEVHKNLLANQPDAFATNRTKAMDQLIGYEGIKSKSNNSNNSNNAVKNDVSDSLVLVTATGNSSNDNNCWYCHEAGHYRLECPKCLAAVSNSDTVKTAVLIHLGDDDDDICHLKMI